MKKYNIINNSLGWLCFIIAAVTYLLTIEPTASFWDCPEFIAQGAKLEVGHPPGNPIFMLTARFFVTIFGNDMSSAALAVNSMSALLSAATILLLFWTITHLVRRIMVKDDATEIPLWRMVVIMGAGMCGALAYTWSDTFWFSAVEGEVYAFSSFCTALVFWLILKWEDCVDKPYSDRYLVLIAYVIGVSIAVHLLNLLCIPAIVLVFYYRKWKSTSLTGSLLALGVSVVLVAAILYGLVPGFIKVAQYFELYCVNALGMSYNSGVLIYAIVLLCVFAAAIFVCYRAKSPLAMRLLVYAVLVLSGLVFATDSVWVHILLVIVFLVALLLLKPLPVRWLNVGLLSVFFIFVGYSSYALLLIRSSANTPMNQNAPDNVFALSSYLNREQYGDRPLFYGPTFAERPEFIYDDDGNYYVLVDENGLPVAKNVEFSEIIYYTEDGEPDTKKKNEYFKVVKSDPSEPDRYEKRESSVDYATSPDMNMLLPRIYSNEAVHANGYKSWSGYSNPDIEAIRKGMPEDTRMQYAQPRYISINGKPTPLRVGPIERYPMPSLKRISVVEGNSDYDQVVWKPSFADNMAYFFNYQLNHMYWRYFMWNFAGRQNDCQGNGEPNLGNWISGIPVIDNARLGDQSMLPDEYSKDNKGHNVYYMLPLLLGLLGIIWQALCRHPRNGGKRGIEQFWVVFFLFFMTGIAIVLYLNQTPGQPRERDYAFAGSFYAFAIWIGMGVPAVHRLLCGLFNLVTDEYKANASEPVDGIDSTERVPAVVNTSAVAAAAVIGLLVPLQMVSQTWDDHDRSHRYTTRDFGANYLNSLAPNAVIFTNGDNDTFPLWYAQEVEGIRTDVRVVNLSYLSTDWYANQLLHPYYDAKAVEMLATPADYAYNRLSFSSVDPYAISAVNAIEGLKAFYESNRNKDDRAVLATPYMFMPTDTAAVAQMFGIEMYPADSTDVFYSMSNLMMDGLSRPFTLSRLLSFDIIANSAAGNYQRPVYFATTVPSDYYLGLDPFMYSTGVAQQVLPFYDSEESPVAEQAYENVMSRFRWGGLDDPKHNRSLYLDETVRRMVTTMRISITDIALDLMAKGDKPASEFAVRWAKEHGQPVPANRYDMARALLALIDEKLPEEAMAYENRSDLTLLDAYLKLYWRTGNPADLKRARELNAKALERYAQYARYAASLYGTDRYNALSYSDAISPHFLLGLAANEVLFDRLPALRQGKGATQGEQAAIELLLDTYNMMQPVYMVAVDEYTPEEIEQYVMQASYMPDVNPSYIRQLLSAAVLARQLSAGGDTPAGAINKVLAPYGLSTKTSGL